MTAILELRRIHKDFSGLSVLQGVDLEIGAEERHAIIGPNGAGKTTLLNVITGKHRPSSGRVLFRGIDVTGYRPYRLIRLGMGRSFQIVNIFPAMTVFENVRNAVLSRRGVYFSMCRSLRGLADVGDETAGVLESIGLSGLRDTPAGELAYGQQRALEIGLTIALDPKLVVLDEPTAGMSAAESREAVALIRRVTERKTLILIEHDMDVVFSLADRISVLHYGRILAHGRPDEIRANREVRDAYLGHREA